MFPNHRSALRALPLIAALSFLAHIHYSKVMRPVRFEHHAFAAARAR